MRCPRARPEGAFEKKGTDLFIHPLRATDCSQSNSKPRHDAPASNPAMLRSASTALSCGSPVRHDLVGRIAEEDVAPVRAPLRDAQGKAMGALVEGDPGHAQALAVLARPHVH